MAPERLFIAIPLPASLRAELAALYEPISGVAWTPPEQLHLTLRFLGEVERPLAETAEAALGAVRVEAFVLPVGGIGAFPPRGAPRVLWVGVGRGHPRLHQLRQQIDDTLLGTGLALDVRRFEPHATLGRVRAEAAPGAVSQFLRRHREFETAPFRADAFRLCASELRPAGAVHRVKREFALAAPG
jgi:RNA 2',3'-cyclic 3'-phosphodiesterase